MKEWDAVAFYNALPVQDGLDSAIRSLAAEARRRGMMEAAEIARHESTLWVSSKPEYEIPDDVAGGRSASNNIAAAIERAAKGEG